MGGYRINLNKQGILHTQWEKRAFGAMPVIFFCRIKSEDNAVWDKSYITERVELTT